MTADPALPEPFDLASADLAADRRAALRAAFPEVFTEGGQVDWDRLRRALGETVDPGKERYGLNWPGKAACFTNIQTPSRATLRPVRGESVGFDATGNVLIEGDNLEVLKLLQKSYLGQVKMIYIDPPYNTGNDFIYPDNYAENLETYLRYTGQTDAEGRAFSTNPETDGRFHSRWLNMMYPRLYLARNLLRDDGVIAITINDAEVANLCALMNEIFGEENFIACAVWQKAYTANMTAQFISDTHDYVLMYARNKESLAFGRFKRTEEQIAKFKNPDNDERGPWKAENLSAGKYYSAGQFTIVGPTGEKFSPPPGRYWRCNEQQYKAWFADKRITFGREDDGRPMLKKFLSEVSEGLTPSTWWDHDHFGSNKEASTELKALFDGQSLFETPKPVKLLRRICDLIPDKDSLILDFFGGSGTTAQAVLELNAQDGGNRRFLLVQLPEPTGRTDFPTIADITKERVRRVIGKLDAAHDGQLALDADPAARPDRGFKVFRLDTSNFLPWDGHAATDAASLRAQLELHVHHLVAGRSPEDLLFELLLKSGYPLTAPVETLSLAGRTVYSVAGGDLLLCLEPDLSEDLLRALAERQPTPARVVCLDAGFAGNDALKTNAVQTMKTRGVTRFQTV